MTRQTIGKWCKKFEESRTNCKTKPSTSTNADHISHADELIRMNHWIKINEIFEELGLSYGSVHSIIHEHLNFNKVCACWVPRSLTDAHRNLRLRSSCDLLERYSAEGAHFLSRIITWDETCVHNFTSERKSVSMIWKRPNSPTTKKFKVVPSGSHIHRTHAKRDNDKFLVIQQYLKKPLKCDKGSQTDENWARE